MTTPDCETIINMAIDDGEQTPIVKDHCRKCAECATTLACLAMIKSSGSPTAGLQPSPTFLQAVDNRISQTISGSSATWFSNKAFIGIVIATTLTIAVAIKMFSPAAPGTVTTTSSVSVSEQNQSTTTTDALNFTNSIANEIQAPTMHFKSPSDDVD